MIVYMSEESENQIFTKSEWCGHCRGKRQERPQGIDNSTFWLQNTSRHSYWYLPLLTDEDMLASPDSESLLHHIFALLRRTNFFFIRFKLLFMFLNWP